VTTAVPRTAGDTGAAGTAAPAGPTAVTGAAAGPAGVDDTVRVDETAGVDDTVARLFVAIARLSRRMRRDAPVALGHGMVSALATVLADGPMRLGDLATAEGVRAPTMSRIVDALVTEGLVERTPDPGDGRVCLVRATASGESVLVGTRATRAAVLAARLERLDPALRAALDAAIPALEALSTDDPGNPAPTER
jgi:DNA-binding MarR family transcriptional regulator